MLKNHVLSVVSSVALTLDIWSGCDYSSYYADVTPEIYKLFNKYERKFGAARSQRATQLVSHTCKRK